MAMRDGPLMADTGPNRGILSMLESGQLRTSKPSQHQSAVGCTADARDIRRTALAFFNDYRNLLEPFQDKRRAGAIAQKPSQLAPIVGSGD